MRWFPRTAHSHLGPIDSRLQEITEKYRGMRIVELNTSISMQNQVSLVGPTAVLLWGSGGWPRSVRSAPLQCTRTPTSTHREGGSNMNIIHVYVLLDARVHLYRLMYGPAHPRLRAIVRLAEDIARICRQTCVQLCVRVRACVWVGGCLSACTYQCFVCLSICVYVRT